MSTVKTVNAYATPDTGSQLEKFSYDLGDLSANEVDIDVLYCGLCHSDLSMIDNEWGITQFPFVGGHEIIGKVSAIGSNVQNVQEGMTVGLGWHSAYCGHCSACNTGDQNLCANAEGTIVARHGGFADKVRATDTSLSLIPEGIDLQAAGPLLCGGVTVFNPFIQYDVKSTDKVAVIGIGGLGHIALQFLNAWGCEVTAFTSTESKRQEALKLGAHKTLDSGSQQDIEAAANSFDLIISTINVNLDWNLYVSTLKPKGRLHFVGITLEPLNIEIFPMILQQKSISGSPSGSPSTMEKMFEFANRHNIKPQIEVFPMSEINDAIDHLKAGKARYRIVLSNV